MATRIAVMEKGAIQQIATPSELYEQPSNRFVADFIGKVNLIEAAVLGQKGKVVSCLTQGLGNMNVSTDKSCGDKATIAIRPEKLKISTTEPKGAGLVKSRATIRDVAYYGDTSHIVADATEGLHLEINVQNNSRTGGSGVERGQKVWVHFDPADALLLTE